MQCGTYRHVEPKDKARHLKVMWYLEMQCGTYRHVEPKDKARHLKVMWYLR
jgi:hypothetical protein